MINKEKIKAYFSVYVFMLMASLASVIINPYMLSWAAAILGSGIIFGLGVVLKKIKVTYINKEDLNEQ